MQTDALILLAGAFKTAGVEYLIVGGYAVVAHGHVRFTADVDLVLHMVPDNILMAFQVLVNLGYQASVPVTAEQFADPEIRKSWVHEKGMMVLNFFHRTQPRNRVDLFVEEPFLFEAVYEKRYTAELPGGARLPFVDLETLKTMKKEAGRPKDLLDLEALRQLSKPHDF